MQLIRCLLTNFYLNMFRASLCPSSGEQDRVLPHMVLCTGCAGSGWLWLCGAASWAVCSAHSSQHVSGIIIFRFMWKMKSALLLLLLFYNFKHNGHTKMFTNNVPTSVILFISTNWFTSFKQIIASHCQYQMKYTNTVWEKFRLELLKYYTH